MENRIINIGRQFGSGGKLVAQELGSRLGIKVYDNELILQAASESGFSQELFRRSDEKKIFFGLDNLGSVISDEQLFRIQSQVIRDIAGRGDAIFVGRASDYVLRDMTCTNVFVCAPKKDRIVRVCNRMNITPDQAAKLIAKKDRGRENFYNYVTFGHWGVASNYELCLDSSVLGIEGTAEFIIDFARRAGRL